MLSSRIGWGLCFGKEFFVRLGLYGDKINGYIVGLDGFTGYIMVSGRDVVGSGGEFY